MTKETLIRLCDRVIEWAFYTLLVVVAFSNSLVEIAAVTMIVAWVLKKLLDRDFRAIDSWPARLMLLVWVWSLLSCFNSQYFSESFRGLFKIFKYGIIFVIAYTELREEAYVKRSLWVMIIAAVLISANGFFQYFTGTDLIRHRQLQPDEAMRRISSSFVHPNDFGAYLMVVSVAFVSSFVSRSLGLSRKIGSFAAFIVSVAALFLTRSRGAWASFAAALVVLGARKSKKIMVTFIALLVVLVVFAPGGMRERITSGMNIKKGTAWERLKLWEGTINMIKVHPVLGFGINTYSRNYPKYTPVDYSDLRYAHNCYLQMAAETGIVGMVLFLGFLVSVFVGASKGISALVPGPRKDLANGLFAGLIGFAINSAVDTHLYSVTLATFFYLLLGYCLALSTNEKK